MVIKLFESFKLFLKIFFFRCVSKENFEKYGIEYPTNLETEVQKSKSSLKKITSFMTPQNQKAKVNSSEK